MNDWFTVKIKYTKELDNGTFKRVSEPYLIASMSFTDAEARVYEELGNVIRGEFNVVGITRTEIHDIFFYDDADTWFKCKVRYDSADADTEKSKKVNQNFLVSASSVKEAFERIKESLSTLMVDFEIPSVILSPIVEIFPRVEDMDREISRKPIETVQESDDFEEEKGKGAVFSASGSDFDDEDDIETEVEDEYDAD
jgi:hypothetical protein